MPNHAQRAQMRERISGACSPMPAVNTRPSRPPKEATSAPISRAARNTNRSTASCARAEHSRQANWSGRVAELNGTAWDGGHGRRPRLRHPEPDDQGGKESDRRNAQKYDCLSKAHRYETEQCGAQRSTDPGCRSNEALGKVEATGAVCGIGNDERRHHANHCATDSIKQLKRK